MSDNIQQPGYNPNQVVNQQSGNMPSQQYYQQPGYAPNQQYIQQPGYYPNQQYIPNQQYYQQFPAPNQYQGGVVWPHMKLKDWIVTYLMMLIPFANIVFIFMWAFGSNVNPSKKTYFQSALIMAAFAMVIGILLSVLLSSVLYSAFSGFRYY